jgi:choline kinase
MTAETGIVLAAGTGSRLRPLTDRLPKCLVEVAGQPLLHRTVAALAGLGCARILVVAGHLIETVRSRLPAVGPGVEIEVVENAEFRTTNSMYSLMLGLDRAVGAAWVVEADVVFEPGMLRRPATGGAGWFADSSTGELDGAYLETDPGGRVRRVGIVRDIAARPPGALKSAGILWLSAPAVVAVRSWLETACREGDSGLYYDLIVARHLEEVEFMAVDVAGNRWFEVDTPADLERARALFS